MTMTVTNTTNTGDELVLACGPAAPGPDDLATLLNFLRFLREVGQYEAYQPRQVSSPCMFDNLPPGVYGLACPCPRHSAYC